MLYRALLPGLLFAVAPAASATAQTFGSLYTDMKKQCKTAPQAADDGGDPAGMCTGYGGYRLYKYHSAASVTVGVQRTKDGQDVVELGTDYGGYGARGEKIEWRTAGGKPFAVIMRVGKYRGEGADGTMYSGQRVGSTLVVRGLPGWEHISGEVDGAAPDANARARAIADAGYARR